VLARFAGVVLDFGESPPLEPVAPRIPVSEVDWADEALLESSVVLASFLELDKMEAVCLEGIFLIP